MSYLSLLRESQDFVSSKRSFKFFDTEHRLNDFDPTFKKIKSASSKLCFVECLFQPCSLVYSKIETLICFLFLRQRRKCIYETFEMSLSLVILPK